jgi:hypothetical protein
MTVPPQNPDPFSTPPSPDPRQHAAPPSLPAPQMPPPPGWQQQPQQWQPISVTPDRSLNKLAPWAIALTGVTTIMYLVSSLMMSGTVDTLKEQLAEAGNGGSAQTSDPVSSLSFFIQVGSYILLAMWMWKLRNLQRARGVNPGGPPAVEWWGWFVPFANLVLPAMGMRALTRRTVGIGTVLGWWIPYVTASIVSVVGGIWAVFSGIDWSTGEFADTSNVDILVPIGWVSTALIALSWVFLTTIIRTATSKESP